MHLRNHATFISFRRINYHQASFAYRDLMFAGLVPWLSDYCVGLSAALSFLVDPTRLQGTLTEAIAKSGCGLALVDDGVFRVPLDPA